MLYELSKQQNSLRIPCSDLHELSKKFLIFFLLHLHMMLGGSHLALNSFDSLIKIILEIRLVISSFSHDFLLFVLLKVLDLNL